MTLTPSGYVRRRPLLNTTTSAMPGVCREGGRKTSSDDSPVRGRGRSSSPVLRTVGRFESPRKGRIRAAKAGGPGRWIRRGRPPMPGGGGEGRGKVDLALHTGHCWGGRGGGGKGGGEEKIYLATGPPGGGGGRGGEGEDQRDVLIYDLYRRRVTYAKIAKRVGISRCGPEGSRRRTRVRRKGELTLPSRLWWVGGRGGNGFCRGAGQGLDERGGLSWRVFFCFFFLFLRWREVFSFRGIADFFLAEFFWPAAWAGDWSGPWFGGQGGESPGEKGKRRNPVPGPRPDRGGSGGGGLVSPAFSCCCRSR